jgi:DNA-binding PadR family transcriptional regulator
MTGVGRDRDGELLLGEWACLGILYQGPSHGFAIAARLKPGGDVGRVWSLSRPLTYRSLEQLVTRELVHAVGEERGIAGGNRTILAASRRGRARFRAWLAAPVPHLRDLRSELLLKLVLAAQCGIDVGVMLERQRAVVESISAALAGGPDDVVTLWRRESSEAALRFVDAVRASGSGHREPGDADGRPVPSVAP